jgi:hypothetical protein
MFPTNTVELALKSTSAAAALAFLAGGACGVVVTEGEVNISIWEGEGGTQEMIKM